jgi:DNA-binding response OmpR family regulator
MVMPETSNHKAAWSYVLDEPARILVADDDPILREFASVYLSTPSATVVTVPDGRAAFDLLNSETFDIAVLDIEMPELDGFSLLEKLRTDSHLTGLPVMMLTGHEDIVSIDRAFNLGANGFATKPVNWRLLSYQIRYVLRSSFLERQARESVGSFPDRQAMDESSRARWEEVLAETGPYSRRLGHFPTGAEARLHRISTIATSALLNDRSSNDTVQAPAAAPQCWVAASG